MKHSNSTKILLGICLLFSLLFTSCVKEFDSYSSSRENKTTSSKSSEKSTNTVVYHIYYASWDEWGHGSMCLGWGLCNFTDCWVCCTDNGVIVDCPTGQEKPNTGTIMVAEGQNSGILTIKLDPNYTEQAAAITNHDTLFVDNQLESDSFYVSPGAYPFLTQIGDHGGYEVNVTKK